MMPRSPQAAVFVTYLGQMECETGSGYLGNCNRATRFVNRVMP